MKRGAVLSLLVLTTGCGLVLDLDPPDPIEGIDAAAGVDAAGLDDAGDDAGGARDAGPMWLDGAVTDASRPDAGRPTTTCAGITVVDQIMLSPAGAAGFLDVTVDAARAIVVYPTPPPLIGHGAVEVELSTFTQTRSGFEASVTLPDRGGPPRLATANGRRHVVVESGGQLRHWSYRMSSTRAPTTSSPPDAFAAASGPEGVAVFASRAGAVSARVFDRDGAFVRSFPVSDAGSMASTEHTDMDAYWSPARGSYVLVLTGPSGAGFPGGTVEVREIGPDGTDRASAIELLSTQPGAASPFHDRPDEARTAWVSATSGRVVAGYFVGAELGVTPLSSDIATLTSFSVTPSYLLSPLVADRWLRAMAIADGLPAVVYATHAPGSGTRLHVMTFDGSFSWTSSDTLGGARVSVAIAPDPTPMGIAVVAYKPVDGAEVVLARLGCSG